MKLSILTPAYNRAEELKKLYNSILVNQEKEDLEYEWLIMDDGSIDHTKHVVDEFIKEQKVKIQYYHQENQGKMRAINNLIKHALGDIIVECDSDDYFTDDFFYTVKENYKWLEKEKNIYALVFKQRVKNAQNIDYKEKKPTQKIEPIKTKMFDLYFKKNYKGETCIIFRADIRKKYHYELEKEERFVTESRMYSKMDLTYNILFFDQEVQEGEYLENGYTKNVKKLFKNNPFGYYQYFKELFLQNWRGVSFQKKFYLYKHYILFSYLTKEKHPIKNIKGLWNKIIVFCLYIPRNDKNKKDIYKIIKREIYYEEMVKKHLVLSLFTNKL